MCRGLCIPFFILPTNTYQTIISVQLSETPVEPLGKDTQGRHGGSVMQLGGGYDERLFTPSSHVTLGNRLNYFVLAGWSLEQGHFDHTEAINILN